MPRRTIRQWRLCPSDAGTLSHKLFVFKGISSEKDGGKSRRCKDTDYCNPADLFVKDNYSFGHARAPFR